MPNWTPGPWRVGTHHQILSTGGDNRCAGIVSYNSWMGIEEAEANAHLIAAAPDMYAALEQLVNTAASYQPHFYNELKQARAALAKARGETA